MSHIASSERVAPVRPPTAEPPAAPPVRPYVAEGEAGLDLGRLTRALRKLGLVRERAGEPIWPGKLAQRSAPRGRLLLAERREFAGPVVPFSLIDKSIRYGRQLRAEQAGRLIAGALAGLRRLYSLLAVA